MHFSINDVFAVLQLDDTYKGLADIETPTCQSTMLEEPTPTQGEDTHALYIFVH